MIAKDLLRAFFAYNFLFKLSYIILCKDLKKKRRIWLSFTVRFTILLTIGFQSSFETPEVCQELDNSLRICQSNCEIWTKVVNFTPNFVGKLPRSLRGKLTLFGKTVGLVIIFKMSPFTVVGKVIPSSVREKITESWLNVFFQNFYWNQLA